MPTPTTPSPGTKRKRNDEAEDDNTPYTIAATFSFQLPSKGNPALLTALVPVVSGYCQLPAHGINPDTFIDAAQNVVHHILGSGIRADFESSISEDIPKGFEDEVDQCFQARRDPWAAMRVSWNVRYVKVLGRHSKAVDKVVLTATLRPRWVEPVKLPFRTNKGNVKFATLNADLNDAVTLNSITQQLLSISPWKPTPTITIPDDPAPFRSGVTYDLTGEDSPPSRGTTRAQDHSIASKASKSPLSSFGQGGFATFKRSQFIDDVDTDAGAAAYKAVDPRKRSARSNELTASSAPIQSKQQELVQSGFAGTKPGELRRSSRKPPSRPKCPYRDALNAEVPCQGRSAKSCGDDSEGISHEYLSAVLDHNSEKDPEYLPRGERRNVARASTTYRNHTKAHGAKRSDDSRTDTIEISSDNAKAAPTKRRKVTPATGTLGPDSDGDSDTPLAKRAKLKSFFASKKSGTSKQTRLSKIPRVATATTPADNHDKNKDFPMADAQPLTTTGSSLPHEASAHPPFMQPKVLSVFSRTPQTPQSQLSGSPIFSDPASPLTPATSVTETPSKTNGSRSPFCVYIPPDDHRAAESQASDDRGGVFKTHSDGLAQAAEQATSSMRLRYSTPVSKVKASDPIAPRKPRHVSHPDIKGIERNLIDAFRACKTQQAPPHLIDNEAMDVDDPPSDSDKLAQREDVGAGHAATVHFPCPDSPTSKVSVRAGLTAFGVAGVAGAAYAGCSNGWWSGAAEWFYSLHLGGTS